MPKRIKVRGSDPLNAQSFRTQRAEMPEDLWQPLYDRANIAASVPSNIGFFSTPRGQSATLITGTTAGTKVKSYRDTNMESSNVVPTKLFKFVGISIAFIHSVRQAVGNGADRDLIRDGGYVQFRIVDKDLLYIPILAVPELNPVAAVATSANNSTMFATAGGGGHGVPMYKLPIQITLNPYENFTFGLNFDGTITLANTLDIYVLLQGYMRRPT